MSPTIIFLLTAIIGGSTTALVKFTVGEFSPFVLNALRFSISSLILLPFVWKHGLNFALKNRPLLMVANLSFAGSVLFSNIGIIYTSVIMTQIIYAPSSLVVAIIGFLFLEEKLSRNQIVGLVLTILGFLIVILGFTEIQDSISFGTIRGNLLTGFAVLCWSSFLIISRKISKIYSPLQITFANFTATAILSMLAIPLQFFRFSKSPVDLQGIIGLTVLILFSTVLVYYLYQLVIKKTSAFISSLVIYVTFVIAAVAGMIFYGERLNLYLVVGSLLILTGVFLATSFKYLSKKWLKIFA